MKRHITSKQVQELSSEQKNRLWDWWRPQAGDRVFHVNKYTAGPQAYKTLLYRHRDNGAWISCDDDHCSSWISYAGLYEHLPLLSIGQMIELLGSALTCTKWSHGYWRVYLEGFEPFQGIYYTEVELCDALWEAVKQFIVSDRSWVVNKITRRYNQLK